MPGKCPRCGCALQGRDIPDVTVGDCSRCFGLWLDNRGCQLLLTGALSEAAKEAIQAVDAQAVKAPPEAQGPRLCPVCGEALQGHVTDEERQGVRVRLDICAAHGTWFDRGEAWTLLQAGELRRLAVDVEIQAAAVERSWAARERAWSGFVAGAARLPRRMP